MSKVSKADRRRVDLYALALRQLVAPYVRLILVIGMIVFTVFVLLMIVPALAVR